LVHLYKRVSNRKGRVNGGEGKKGKEGQRAGGKWRKEKKLVWTTPV